MGKKGIMRKLFITLLATMALLAPSAAGAVGTPDEVGFVDPASGLWNLGPDESFYFGVPGDIPFLGDWDGDGIDTPGLYRPSDGFAYVINRRETGFADTSWFMGIPGDVPIAGDWDGDGVDTFSVYRPSEGKVYINNENQTDVAQNEYFFGVPQDKPFAIDFNLDGKDDIGLHRESTGLVYMTDAVTGGVPDGAVAATDLEFFWGIADDAVFAGDWNGTGVDSPGLVRPALARTFLRYANTLGVADEQWPNPFAGWVPVVGRIPGAATRYDVELSGGEVIEGGQPGGSGSVRLSIAASGEVCFTFEFDTVTGVTAAHIHDGAAGEAGPHVVDLGVSGGDAFGCVTASPAIAIAVLERPEDYHVQVHTTAYPDGAVRGQIASTATWELAMVGAQVVGVGDADAFATMTLDVSSSGRICVSSFAAQRMAATTSIGLFAAPAGVDGPRLADLTFGPDHAGCTVVTPASVASAVLALPSATYVQVATAQFPDGAVRAQLASTS